MEELFDFICEDKIGSGVYRDVYKLSFNDKYVIKVARDEQGRANNLLEERLWCEVMSTPLANWFAPILQVSGAGKYLIQERVDGLPREKYPTMIPHFFTDTKYSNFGWLKGKGFVCCDYGSFNIFRGITKKMVKASWWE